MAQKNVITADEFEALRVQQAQTARLLDVSRRLSGADTPDEILEALTPVAEYIKASGASLLFVDPYDDKPEWAELVASRAFDGTAAPPAAQRFHIPDFPMSQIVLSDQILLIGDVDDPSVAETDRQLLKMSGAAAIASFMLRQRDGKIIASFTLKWAQPHPFTPQERILYDTLQALMTSAVVNLRQRAARESIIQQSASELLQFRALADSALDGIAVSSASTLQIVYANRALCDMLGYDYDSGEIIGVNGLSMWPEEAKPMMEQEVLPQLLQQGSWRGEATLQTRHGRRIIVDSTTFMIADESSQLTRIGTILRDVTEAKLAQQERETLQQQVIEAQRRTLADLSTPIIPVMDGIIVMPLVGSVDTARAREIMRALLRGISEYRARVAILDITGVPLVDSGVADHLNHTIQAARLKGAHTIVTGISDAVAETIVDLGIDWSRVETMSNLQSGLVAALDRIGLRLATVNHATNGK
ncbi:MAG: STAS domain-containing protein [Aggregatilineales bacterium]